MQYAFQLNKPHKKKKPGKPKLVGQKADLLFFYPTKECLQFLYVTVIEVLQSVKNVDTVAFVPGTGKEFLRGYAEVFTDAQKFVHTQSIICAFGLAAAVPRSPYRHLELCGIAFNFSSAHPPGR